MKPSRILKKDYEELLKIMRRWVDPYRALVAKLVGHIAWQEAEIRKLETWVNEFQQKAFFEEKKRVEARRVAPNLTPPPAPEKWPVGRRLSNLRYNGDQGSKHWMDILRWHRINEEQALNLADEYDKKRPNYTGDQNSCKSNTLPNLSSTQEKSPSPSSESSPKA